MARPAWPLPRRMDESSWNRLLIGGALAAVLIFTVAGPLLRHVTPAALAQQLVNGLFTGSVYALFAVGYTLVFGVLDILNLAHASIFAVGGMSSIPGALLGGFLIGLIAAVTVAFYASQLRDAAFTVLFRMLLIRPGGLFGVRGGRGV